MPRLVYRKPTYRKHISGQAVVTIHGVDHYLGRYGTAESRVKYRRLIAEGEVLGANSRLESERAKFPGREIQALEWTRRRPDAVHFGSLSSSFNEIAFGVPQI